jgi:hypothetical protein
MALYCEGNDQRVTLDAVTARMMFSAAERVAELVENGRVEVDRFADLAKLARNAIDQFVALNDDEREVVALMMQAALEPVSLLAPKTVTFDFSLGLRVIAFDDMPMPLSWALQ